MLLIEMTFKEFITKVVNNLDSLYEEFQVDLEPELASSLISQIARDYINLWEDNFFQNSACFNNENSNIKGFPYSENLKSRIKPLFTNPISPCPKNINPSNLWSHIPSYFLKSYFIDCRSPSAQESSTYTEGSFALRPVVASSKLLEKTYRKNKRRYILANFLPKRTLNLPLFITEENYHENVIIKLKNAFVNIFGEYNWFIEHRIESSYLDFFYCKNSLLEFLGKTRVSPLFFLTNSMNIQYSAFSCAARLSDIQVRFITHGCWVNQGPPWRQKIGSHLARSVTRPDIVDIIFPRFSWQLSGMKTEGIKVIPQNLTHEKSDFKPPKRAAQNFGKDLKVLIAHNFVPDQFGLGALFTSKSDFLLILKFIIENSDKFSSRIKFRLKVKLSETKNDLFKYKAHQLRAFPAEIRDLISGTDAISDVSYNSYHSEFSNANLILAGGNTNSIFDALETSADVILLRAKKEKYPELDVEKINQLTNRGFSGRLMAHTLDENFIQDLNALCE